MKTLTINDYIITKEGQIINKKSGRTIKPQKNGKGYLRVSISGKLMFVHRLVAELYIPNPLNKPQVNHKDGDKLNNSVDNLEWVDNVENRKHAVRNNLHLSGGACHYAKLLKSDVEKIREIGFSKPRKEVADMFGVSYQTICDILHNRTWTNS